MSECRKADYIVTLRAPQCVGDQKLKIEIFRKSQWTGELVDILLYRLRINGVWHGGSHNGMEFMNKEDVLALLRSKMAEGGVA